MKNSYYFADTNAYSALFDDEHFSHAYIIYGDDGRLALAETLAAAILCTGAGNKPCGACPACRKSIRAIHPDIARLDKPKDKKSIPVVIIRDLIADTAILPNDAGHKVYIIRDGDNLSPIGQNALLKTLEEPPRYITIIIVMQNLSLLLPTVRSRCIEIGALSQGAPLPDATAAMAERLFDACNAGALAVTEFAYSLEKLEKPEIKSFLDYAHGEATARMAVSLTNGSGQYAHYAKIERTLSTLQRYFDSNVSVVHVIGYLTASLIEKV